MELQSVYGHADALDAELAREHSAGRMFRLLLKMGMVNERPHLRRDTQWAETVRAQEISNESSINEVQLMGISLTRAPRKHLIVSSVHEGKSLLPQTLS